ncbi:hypothetical protein PGT21_036722 [Puccinia graminis f. sp. tritici]|uniref:Uncharacterized protein n=1 Tax=Puccinia graminis f. sp. tritici TaxID=56615 RepID=A0A5B0P5H8_PUCGR|nr:hypothetical protein PGT21_036722 [Puccinia graminis f. sp. tritici]KAA1121497.1 hypothetical protein PGTUg99_029546 [Puccinia graminis f. sp. tritici]
MALPTGGAATNPSGPPRNPSGPPGGRFSSDRAGSFVFVRRIVVGTSEHAQDPRIPLGTLGLRSERSLNPSRPPNDPGSSSDAPEPTGSSSDDPDRPPAPQSTPRSASVLPIAHQGLLKAPDTYRQAPRHQATPQSTQQPTGAPPSHPVTP